MKWARTTGFDITLCTIRTGRDFLVHPVTTQLSEVYKKHIEPAGKKAYTTTREISTFSTYGLTVSFYTTHIYLK